MAAPTATTSWLEVAFLSAKKDFLASLKNKTTSKFDFSKLATVDDVYEAASEIQRQQAKTKSYRGLKRIEPFIKVLQEYGGVADTFAQIKPDILCLIWVRPLGICSAQARRLLTFPGAAQVLAPGRQFADSSLREDRQGSRRCRPDPAQFQAVCSAVSAK